MKPTKRMRVLLDEGAELALSSMNEILKQEEKFILINPSKLCSWIISEFFKSNFEQAKGKIIQSHFNSKEYIRSLADEMDDLDPQEALSKALNRLKQRPKRRNPGQTPPLENIEA